MKAEFESGLILNCYNTSQVAAATIMLMILYFTLAVKQWNNYAFIDIIF